MGEHQGHRERLRRQYRECGGAGMEEGRLLELLLFRAIPRGDVYPLALRLLERFGTLERVLGADAAEIVGVRGAGPRTAKVLRAAGEALGVRESPRGTVISGPQAAGDYLIPHFLGETDEAMYVMCLDAGHGLLAVRQVSRGGAESVRVDTAELAETAASTGCAYAILAHNHPSGIALPSDADERATVLLRRALGERGVELLDHIIISGDDFVSLRDNGFFD